jgi:hypothetical protein
MIEILSRHKGLMAFAGVIAILAFAGEWISLLPDGIAHAGMFKASVAAATLFGCVASVLFYAAQQLPEICADTCRNLSLRDKVVLAASAAVALVAFGAEWNNLLHSGTPNLTMCGMLWASMAAAILFGCVAFLVTLISWIKLESRFTER